MRVVSLHLRLKLFLLLECQHAPLFVHLLGRPLSLLRFSQIVLGFLLKRLNLLVQVVYFFLNLVDLVRKIGH